MSQRPVSEKAAEILFNRFLLQSFPLGSVQLFAPSSLEEFKSGYDSKVVGFSSMREIYLQFKSPLYSESRERFTISLTEHQHDLLKTYPPRTAFYVAPMFRTLAELNVAQAELNVAADFLKHFVCIDVSALPQHVDFFHFVKPTNHHESPRIKFKTPEDGKTRVAMHPVVGDAWHRGTTLLKKFRAGEAGAHLTLSNNYLGRSEMHCYDAIMPEKIFAAAEDLSGAEFGLLVRTPA